MPETVHRESGHLRYNAAYEDPQYHDSVLSSVGEKQREAEDIAGQEGQSSDPLSTWVRCVPSVQMALQTEEKYFRINYAFHSRYRYRQKLFWN